MEALAMNVLVKCVARAAIAVSVGTLFATSSIAAPKGVVNLGQKLTQFNVIAKPGAWDPSLDGNACNGARIFFAEDSGGPNNTLGSITWNLDPTVNGFQITDCNGTDGTATVTADENVNFAVVIRVVGPKTSALNFVCTVVTQSAGDNLCMIDSATFHKGNSFTKVMSNIADNTFEQVLWTLSGDWKIFQVRLYELLP
jgi:hypothetical protein